MRTHWPAGQPVLSAWWCPGAPGCRRVDSGCRHPLHTSGQPVSQHTDHRCHLQSTALYLLLHSRRSHGCHLLQALTWTLQGILGNALSAWLYGCPTKHHLGGLFPSVPSFSTLQYFKWAHRKNNYSLWKELMKEKREGREERRVGKETEKRSDASSKNIQHQHSWGRR